MDFFFVGDILIIIYFREPYFMKYCTALGFRDILFLITSSRFYYYVCIFNLKAVIIGFKKLFEIDSLTRFL